MTEPSTVEEALVGQIADWLDARAAEPGNRTQATSSAGPALHNAALALREGAVRPRRPEPSTVEAGHNPWSMRCGRRVDGEPYRDGEFCAICEPEQQPPGPQHPPRPTWHHPFG